MCASYGLGGSLPLDLEPLSEPEYATLIRDWIGEQDAGAKITGKNARNLNPIVRAKPSGERYAQLAWWWLWLDAGGPVKFSAFNSRDDRLLRSWKRPFQARAILPATWYVEKQGRFHLPSDDAFGIAALTSTVTLEDGSELVSYSMVTRDAVGEAAEVWPRMPLVLPRDFHDEWLDPERAGDADLVAESRLASESISHELTRMYS
ncbi:SOS response-associated peptidase family protein [Leucobacter sp. USHLN153]|uniref:SOS response-associated peptidase family protein n=1 Tax=Leucobacter sp. USHLN153 TaxID=3081268 RepID=UPI003018B3F2